MKFSTQISALLILAVATSALSPRKTQIRCTRVITGNGDNSIEPCSQSEEGKDGCECGETTATKKAIRCVRVITGNGGNSIEQCSQSEEGKDGCECGETTVLA